MRSEPFKKEINLIRDERLREFITYYMEECVPDYFYHVPASSSGKYHPSYTLGDGGLVRHTKAAVKIAESLLTLEQNATLDELYHDEIIAALIVHDTFKQGIKTNGNTIFEHPLVAAEALFLISKEVYGEEFSNRVVPICDLVKTHMGQWNTSKHSKVVLGKPATNAQKFVHMCDYLASRKFIIVELQDE